MNVKGRSAVAGMALSALAFIGLVTHEGYTDRAIIPTKNDRPTLGFGSTFHEDGKAVKMGESTTPVRALIKAQAHIGKEEEIFRASLPGVSLFQGEYDIYLGWVYQYGNGAWAKSSMRRNLIAGNYTQACNSLLLYKFSGGYDCSIPGNKVCAGVWKRNVERNQQCIALQD